jgi:tetratricopeptide (TPR) repeat protein
MRHSYFAKNICLYIDKYLDKEGSDKVKQHIEECTECAELYRKIIKAKKLTELNLMHKRPEELDTMLEKVISSNIKISTEAGVSRFKIEEVLSRVGMYVWPNNELKKGLLIAATIFIIAIAYNMFGVKYNGITPIVIASRGPAQILRSSDLKWDPIAPGTKIHEGDIVKLEAYAQVDLKSNNLFNMRIKQNSRVHFIKLAKNYNSKMEFNINQGTAMFAAKPRFKGSAMKIATPSARVSVLGTAFTVDVNPVTQGATWVYVLSGQVMVEGIEVSSQDSDYNNVIVNAGRKTLVKPGDVPTIPEIFSDKEWNAMDELYRIGDLPQVALLMGSGADRVEELMRPCMLYIYDAKPRKLSHEFDDAVRLISEANKTNNLELHQDAADKLGLLVAQYPNPIYDVQFRLFLGAYNFFLKNYDESIFMFDKIIHDIQHSSLVSLAMCAKAFVYEKGLNNYKDAHIIYSNILDYYPDTPDAEYAEKALKKHQN